jgi:hypothetical protein
VDLIAGVRQLTDGSNYAPHYDYQNLRVDADADHASSAQRQTPTFRVVAKRSLRPNTVKCTSAARARRKNQASQNTPRVRYKWTTDIDMTLLRYYALYHVNYKKKQATERALASGSKEYECDEDEESEKRLDISDSSDEDAPSTSRECKVHKWIAQQVAKENQAMYVGARTAIQPERCSVQAGRRFRHVLALALRLICIVSLCGAVVEHRITMWSIRLQRKYERESIGYFNNHTTRRQRH